MTIGLWCTRCEVGWTGDITDRCWSCEQFGQQATHNTCHPTVTQRDITESTRTHWRTQA